MGARQYLGYLWESTKETLHERSGQARQIGRGVVQGAREFANENIVQPAKGLGLHAGEGIHSLVTNPGQHLRDIRAGYGEVWNGTVNSAKEFYNTPNKGQRFVAHVQQQVAEYKEGYAAAAARGEGLEYLARTGTKGALSVGGGGVGAARSGLALARAGAGAAARGGRSLARGVGHLAREAARPGALGKAVQGARGAAGHALAKGKGVVTAAKGAGGRALAKGKHAVKKATALSRSKKARSKKKTSCPLAAKKGKAGPAGKGKKGPGGKDGKGGTHRTSTRPEGKPTGAVQRFKAAAASARATAAAKVESAGASINRAVGEVPGLSQLRKIREAGPGGSGPTPWLHPNPESLPKIHLQQGTGTCGPVAIANALAMMGVQLGRQAEPIALAAANKMHLEWWSRMPAPVRRVVPAIRDWNKGIRESELAKIAAKMNDMKIAGLAGKRVEAFAVRPKSPADIMALTNNGRTPLVHFLSDHARVLQKVEVVNGERWYIVADSGAGQGWLRLSEKQFFRDLNKSSPMYQMAIRDASAAPRTTPILSAPPRAATPQLVSSAKNQQIMAEAQQRAQLRQQLATPLSRAPTAPIAPPAPAVPIKPPAPAVPVAPTPPVVRTPGTAQTSVRPQAPISAKPPSPSPKVPPLTAPPRSPVPAAPPAEPALAPHPATPERPAGSTPVSTQPPAAASPPATGPAANPPHGGPALPAEPPPSGGGPQGPPTALPPMQLPGQKQVAPGSPGWRGKIV